MTAFIDHHYGTYSKELQKHSQSIAYRLELLCLTETGVTDFLAILSGVQQVCILSSFFFLIHFDFVMQKAIDTEEPG